MQKTKSSNETESLPTFEVRGNKFKITPHFIYRFDRRSSNQKYKPVDLEKYLVGAIDRSHVIEYTGSAWSILKHGIKKTLYLYDSSVNLLYVLVEDEKDKDALAFATCYNPAKLNWFQKYKKSKEAKITGLKFFS